MHDGTVAITECTTAQLPSLNARRQSCHHWHTGMTETPATPAEVNAGTASPGFVDETTATMYGHKATHVAVEFGLGGVTPYVGYSEKKMNNSAAKSKTMHYGLSGSLGDTGMSYLVDGQKCHGSGLMA